MDKTDSYQDIGARKAGSGGKDDIHTFNTLIDSNMPSDYIEKYNIYIFCNDGTAQFSAKDRTYEIKAGDFTIWQTGQDIRDVKYSAGFDADCLLVSQPYLSMNLPSKVQPAKTDDRIRRNNVFSLENDEITFIQSDFYRFREQLSRKRHIYRQEILARLMQIFIYDLWNICDSAIRREA